MSIKSRLFFLALLISLLLSMTLTACGAIETGTLSGITLGTGETIRGMQAAMAEKTGTIILQNSNMLLFAWPRGASYAFAFLCEATCPDVNSLKLDPVDLTTMINSLNRSGWQRILPAAVPVKIAQALAYTSVEAAATAMRTLPSIVVIPVVMFTPPAYPEVQQ